MYNITPLKSIVIEDVQVCKISMDLEPNSSDKNIIWTMHRNFACNDKLSISRLSKYHWFCPNSDMVTLLQDYKATSCHMLFLACNVTFKYISVYRCTHWWASTKHTTEQKYPNLRTAPTSHGVWSWHQIFMVALTFAFPAVQPIEVNYLDRKEEPAIIDPEEEEARLD